MKMRYAVVIEKSETGFGAYVPDLPGCVAVGETMTETEQLIREAVEFHLEGLREMVFPHRSPLQWRSTWRSDAEPTGCRRRRKAPAVFCESKIRRARPRALAVEHPHKSYERTRNNKNKMLSLSKGYPPEQAS